jgi:hypothetical protein
MLKESREGQQQMSGSEKRFALLVEALTRTVIILFFNTHGQSRSIASSTLKKVIHNAFNIVCY